MDVLIIGAGGHGKVVLDILRAAGKHRPVGFIDADPGLIGSTVNGLPVLGQANLLPKLRSRAAGAIVAIGDNRARQRYGQMIAQQGWELVNAIHPSAVVSDSVKLASGIMIAAGAIVGPDVEIAESVIVNTAAVIEHECRLAAAVHACPAAALAGRVTVGEGAFLGLGCRIIQCLNVGAHSIVGAGAVVIRDVVEGVTVVGVPAREVRAAAEVEGLRV